MPLLSLAKIFSCLILVWKPYKPMTLRRSAHFEKPQFTHLQKGGIGISAVLRTSNILSLISFTIIENFTLKWTTILLFTLLLLSFYR